MSFLNVGGTLQGHRRANIFLSSGAIAPSLAGADVLMLLHLDATPFIDSSPYAAEVVPFAGVQASALAKFGAAALDSDGTNNSHLQIANGNFAFAAADDYTFTMWIRPRTIQPGVQFFTGQANGAGRWLIQAGGALSFRHAGVDFACGNIAALLNTWIHIAAVRSAGVNFMFLNGALQSTAADGGSFSDIRSDYLNPPGNTPFNGVIDEILFVRLKALWTAAFVPPTGPFSTAGALAAAIDTWNPFDKGGACTLSGGNLTASTTASLDAVKAKTYHATGHWYFEISGMTNTENVLGITSDIGGTTVFPGGTIQGFGYYDVTGQKFNNGVGAGYGAAYAPGDVIGVEFNNGDLTFWKNGVSQGLAFAGIVGSFTPAWGPATGGAGTRTATLNIGTTAFAFAIPAGAAAWG